MLARGKIEKANVTHDRVDSALRLGATPKEDGGETR
jgi:hypothetical protein